LGGGGGVTYLPGKTAMLKLQGSLLGGGVCINTGEQEEREGWDDKEFSGFFGLPNQSWGGISNWVKKKKTA